MGEKLKKLVKELVKVVVAKKYAAIATERKKRKKRSFPKGKKISGREMPEFNQFVLKF